MKCQLDAIHELVKELKEAELPEHPTQYPFEDAFGTQYEIEHSIDASTKARTITMTFKDECGKDHKFIVPLLWWTYNPDYLQQVVRLSSLYIVLNGRVVKNLL